MPHNAAEATPDERFAAHGEGLDDHRRWDGLQLSWLLLALGLLATTGAVVVSTRAGVGAMGVVAVGVGTALAIGGWIASFLAIRAVERSEREVQRLTAQLTQVVAHLQTVLEAATEVSIIAGDPQGKITIFNSGAERMLGYSRDELIGRATPEILHDPAEIAEHAARLTEEFGEPVTGFGAFVERARRGTHEAREWTYVRKDGGRLTVSLTVTAHRDAQGQITGYLGIATDVTAQRRAEQELRDAMARSRAILETAIDGIVTIDADGVIDSVNPAAEQIFGYSASELVGHQVSMLIPEAYRRLHEDALGRYQGRESSRVVGHRLELAALRRDGSEVPIELGVSEFFLGDRRMFTGVLRDITERKQAESEVRRAKEQAEAANRAKSEFLANMSHEIRTPMNGVLGMTELALDTDLTPQQREYLETVRCSAEALLTVINDILDFSKIEAGRLELESIPFGFRECIEDTLRTLALRAHAKGLELSVRIAPNVPEVVLGDPLRLRQVLVNLVGNAIKFTERGEVVLTAEVDSSPDDDAVNVRLSVTDTGIGIPPEVLRTIFDPFQQADGSTTRRFGGTGLGLAITRTLVEIMGGRLWVESEPGWGSTFRATLRLVPQTSPAPGTPLAGIHRLHGLSVLVVDDNATNRRILEEVLHGWGVVPTAVADGETALVMLRQAVRAGQPFPLVLLDGMMPVMDGFTLAEEISQDEGLGGTIIMMLTSIERNAEQRCRNSAKIAARLTKPIRQADLLRAILTILDQPPVQGPDDPPKTLTPLPADQANLAVRPATILVAEDKEVNRRVVTGMLQRLGHTSVAVTNGREALDALDRTRFDLILMDVQMPEMDGYSAVSAIRAAECGGESHLPVIALTAHAMKGDREKCLAAGFDDYLSKPVRSAELARALTSWLPITSNPTEGPPQPPAPHSPAPDLDFRRAEALEYLGNDEELLREIVELFLAEVDRQLEMLREATTRGDTDTLQRTAHALKGSAGHVGAAKVAQVARDLESLGATGTVEGAARHLDALVRDLSAFRQAVAEYQHQPTP